MAWPKLDNLARKCTFKALAWPHFIIFELGSKNAGFSLAGKDSEILRFATKALFLFCRQVSLNIEMVGKFPWPDAGDTYGKIMVFKIMLWGNGVPGLSLLVPWRNASLFPCETLSASEASEAGVYFLSETGFISHSLGCWIESCSEYPFTSAGSDRGKECEWVHSGRRRIT